MYVIIIFLILGIITSRLANKIGKEHFGFYELYKLIIHKLKLILKMK